MHGFDHPCKCQTGLAGEPSNVDTLIAETMAAARSLFPEQTAQAESWAAQRLAAYGVNYAKYRAEQAYGSLAAIFDNPWIVLGSGLFIGYLLWKR